MFKKIFIFIILSSLTFCTSEKKAKIQTRLNIPLETLYKSGFENFKNKNYDQAIKVFEKVEIDYSYTEWAPKALLMKSYIYYDTANYIIALANLQRFKKRYAGHKDFIYAEYLIAMCLFEQINFVALSQENTLLSLKQFEKIIQNYPGTEYANDLKFKIDLINEQLAAKEMYLARYYMKRDKFVPALYRLNKVVDSYQNTIFIEEALHRLVEINYRIGNVKSAKKYASILGYNFNDSDWYKKSYNIVESSKVSLERDKKKKSLKEKVLQIIQMK